jgi:pimeloyl-ACP methyl ester carboxylesterase
MHHGNSSSRRCYVDGKWGQVHCRMAGRADVEAPPLVLVHQSPWSSVQYQAVLPRLAAAGHRAIAPDSPGYGLSDPAPEGAGIADHADNLALVMASLGCPRAIVIGHHTGALIAAALAARHPEIVHGLVLDNLPLYTPAERASRAALHGNAAVLRPDGSHLTDRWALMRQRGDPEFSDASIQLAIIAWAQAGRDGGHAAAFAHDAAADLQAIKAATLCLAGCTDPLFGHLERILAARPDFDAIALPGGAAMHLEQADQWVAAILPFIASIPQSTGGRSAIIPEMLNDIAAPRRPFRPQPENV